MGVVLSPRDLVASKAGLRYWLFEDCTSPIAAGLSSSFHIVIALSGSVVPIPRYCKELFQNRFALASKLLELLNCICPVDPAADAPGTPSHVRFPEEPCFRYVFADPSAAGQVYVGTPIFVIPVDTSMVKDFEVPSTVSIFCCISAPFIMSGLFDPAPPVCTAKAGDDSKIAADNNMKNLFKGFS